MPFSFLSSVIPMTLCLRPLRVKFFSFIPAGSLHRAARSTSRTCWPFHAYSCTAVASARQRLDAFRAPDPTLDASFHRSPVGNLQGLPFCNHCQRVSPHRPMAVEQGKEKIWVGIQKGRKERKEAEKQHSQFSGMVRGQMNRFPIVEFQNSTCPFCWRISTRENKHNTISNQFHRIFQCRLYVRLPLTLPEPST